VAERPPRRRRDDNDDDRPRPSASRRSQPGRGAPRKGAPKRSGRPPPRDGRPRRDDDRPARGRPPAAGKRAPRRDDDHPARGRPPVARKGAARRDGNRRDDERRGRGPKRDEKPRGRRKGGAEGSPTRSGIQYPPRRTVRRDVESEVVPTPKRPVLRRVRSEAPAPKSKPAARTSKAPAGPPRRRRRSTEAADELARIAGRDATRAQDQLAKAAEAYTAGRERDAARLLRPLRDAYPDAAAVRELLGLVHYRLGQYPAASKELTAFADLTGSVEQHPVLMDCWRAQHRYRKVDELWRELANASPSAALVTEGRIVLAGSLADDGRLDEAIATLERRGADAKRVQDHHLRLWYALADLYERAGEVPRARELFERVARHDPAFADVAERLAAIA
jgi:hypothetical protein